MTHSCKELLCSAPHEQEPFKSEWTDQTIPISCGECSETRIGIPLMTQHVMGAHPGYRQDEAEIYATSWAEDAYRKEQEDALEYYHRLKEANGYEG